MVELLAAMLRDRTKPLHFQVTQVGPQLHVIEEPHDGLTMVDSQRRLVFEGNPACECRVPLGFPGRVEPDLYFQVRWMDDLGEDRCYVLAAPAPTWARLAVGAPREAVVTILT